MMLRIWRWKMKNHQVRQHLMITWVKLMEALLGQEGEGVEEVSQKTPEVVVWEIR